MKTSRNTNGNGRSQGKGNGNGRDGHNQKGKYFYPKYLQEKLAITVLVITLALFALIMVLYRIIRDNNEQYNKIVLTQRQQEYESRVIPYRRGDIVDRNGTYLATSEKVYNLIIDPRQIMSAPERYLEPTIETLVASFGFDAGELRAMIEEKKDSAYLRYRPARCRLRLNRCIELCCCTAYFLRLQRYGGCKSAVGIYRPQFRLYLRTRT